MARVKTEEPKQVKLTDEIRSKLHGFALVSNTVTLPYKVTIEGVPENFLPVFTVSTLSVSEQGELKNKQYDIENEEYFSELIRTHIFGWKNLYDLSVDELVMFKAEEGTKFCSKELYAMLPNSVKIDILSYITVASAR